MYISMFIAASGADVCVYLDAGSASIEAKRSRQAKTVRFVNSLGRDAENEFEEDSSRGGSIGGDTVLQTTDRIDMIPSC